MSTKSNKSRKYLILTFLALGQGSVYFLPYLRAVYYNPLLETLQCSNAELGSLVSFFAMGCMLLYIPGGIMSDRWNYKKCITWSLFSTSVLVASFAFVMNFTYARILYFLLAFSTTFVFWSSNLKAVRSIGDSDNQGKTYGFFYSAQGLISIVVNNIWLLTFNSFADQQLGLRVILLGNATMNLIAGLACHFMLEEPAKVSAAERANNPNAFQLKKVVDVVKNPLVWFIALMLFCAYGLYQNSFYYSNFLVNIKGMDEYWGSQFSLIRVTYMMCVASYIGGFFADKLKSTVKMFAICGTCAGVAAFAMLALMYTDINVFVLGVLSLLPSAFMLAVYGLASSLYEEFKVPLAYTGTAIGLVSIVGYTPDLFFGPLLGGFLDRQGDAGYASIFTFYGGLCVALLVLSLIALKLKNSRICKETSSSAQ